MSSTGSCTQTAISSASPSPIHTMATSLTSSFRELCAQSTPQPPPQPKRRRAPLHRSTSQPTASSSTSPSAATAPSTADDDSDPFLAEAYKIVSLMPISHHT